MDTNNLREPRQIIGRRLKVLTALFLSTNLFLYSYRKLRRDDPESCKQKVWEPLVRKVYPSLLKHCNHDFLHFLFVEAAAKDLLPILPS